MITPKSLKSIRLLALGTRGDAQPFWASQVAQLGVGPQPIPYKKLTANKLASPPGTFR